MKIIEDIRYTIDDIIDQIKVDFGFKYEESGDGKGSVALGGGYVLEIEFSEEPKLSKALLRLPGPAIDVTESQIGLEMMNSCSESAIQVLDLISRMTSGGSDHEID